MLQVVNHQLLSTAYEYTPLASESIANLLPPEVATYDLVFLPVTLVQELVRLVARELDVSLNVTVEPGKR